MRPAVFLTAGIGFGESLASLIVGTRCWGVTACDGRLERSERERRQVNVAAGEDHADSRRATIGVFGQA